MPSITVGDNTVEVPADKRLVLAIEQDLGIDILHRCGGYAQCTTCRVSVGEGEPETMTAAELQRLEAGELLGEYRLSCQLLCDNDMTVTPAFTLEESEFDGPGDTPEDQITPEPEWGTRPTGE